MKQPRRKSETEKLSVSLSKTVYSWAVELADKKGFDTNFSAYIADLIRRDRERELADTRIFSQFNPDPSQSKCDAMQHLRAFR